MSKAETFRGYSPEQGMISLLKIIKYDYNARGLICPLTRCLSVTGLSDTANIQEIFCTGNVVAVTDPVYPVYVDSNAMAGRIGDYDSKTGKWTNLVYLPCTAENNFIRRCPTKG